LVIFTFWRYFGHFLGLRVILVISSYRGGYFGHFVRFQGYFSYFLDLGFISTIFKDFMSTLVIFKFHGQFGYFDYWVIGWVMVYS